MKKIFKLFLVALLLILCACQSKTNTEKDNHVSMLVSSVGNNRDYYEKIKNCIKEDLDIEIDFIYQNASDTTTSIILEFKNNDLCADIMTSSIAIDEDYLRNSCLDLMANSHILDYFTYQKARQFVTENGEIYQIPFTSKLIGITYNKTLMEEMGYQVPNSFDEMVALKNQCEKDGIVFSVTGMAATGHGFNYLFHTTGTNWISTLEGSTWFEQYINGDASIEPLKQQAEYFKKWVENGLFQNIHDQDWSSNVEYAEKRALFLFEITSAIPSIERTYVDENGNTVTSTDELASMPWISEDGNNNCYTFYDNMYLSLNKNLILEENKDRLNNAIKVLEYLTTNKAASIFADLNKDGYVATNDFRIDETRLYYNYANQINSGYLQPWYYSSFYGDTIVSTGEVINRYIKDGSMTFDDIFETLDKNHHSYLNKEIKKLADIDETLDYKEVAIIDGYASIYACENNVDGALVPYIEKRGDFFPFSGYGVVNTKIYAGDFEDYQIETIIPANGKDIAILNIDGAFLKQIILDGLTSKDEHYPYVLVGIDSIDDSKQYKIAVNTNGIEKTIYRSLLDNKQFLCDESGNVVTYKLKNGLEKYFEQNSIIKKNGLNK